MTGDTVLLVDDDQDFLDTLSFRCESIGLRVQKAKNLLTASWKLNQPHLGLVCVDINMPTGNGIEFCRSLRQDPKTEAVPVVVISGCVDVEAMMMCRKLGIACLSKSASLWNELFLYIREIELDCRTYFKTAPHELHTPRFTQLDLVREGRPAGNGRVLVANDDQDVAVKVADACAKTGCTVFRTRSGVDALSLAQRIKPDILCVDASMSSGSGLGIGRIIADRLPHRLVHILVLTDRGNKFGPADEFGVETTFIEKCSNLAEEIQEALTVVLKGAAKPDGDRTSGRNPRAALIQVLS